ncbi:MAG: hypothetical protein K5876_04545 [Ruminiclostridium sp.]|nr:hypothetical protein [Ruminiclostridium sp.]
MAAMIKKRLFRRIAAAALCVCVLLCYVPSALAVRTTPGIISGEFTYYPSGEWQPETDSFFYSDAYFARTGKAPDPHLRSMSLILALTTAKLERTEDLLEKAGFSAKDISAEDMDGSPTCDTIGSVISHKSTVYGEVIAVAIRGVNYGKEWSNNFETGADGDIKGFSDAAHRIVNRIKEYERRRGLHGAKLWITGYSRGGAVADLAGKYINASLADFGMTADDLYVYTFEAPAGSAERTGCENIHNVTNPNDAIPLVYPEAWGLSRSGVTELLPADEIRIYRKELTLSVTGLGLTNRYELIPGEDIWTMPTKEISPAVPLDAFEREFAAWLSSGTGRAEFVRYGGDIADLLEVFAFRGLADNARLTMFMSRVMTKMLSAATISYIISLADCKPGSEKYEDALDKLTDRFYTAMDSTERGDLITGEEFDAVRRAVPGVIRFALPLVRGDLSSEHELEFFGTFIGNLETIVSEHYIQKVFALVKKTDSYYTDGVDIGARTSEGTFGDVTDSERNFCRAAVTTAGDELARAVLTADELAELNTGSNVIVSLSASESAVRPEDKEALANALTAAGRGSRVGAYMGLSLTKKVGNTVRRRTASSSSPVTVTIKVPRGLLNRDSSVIRDIDAVAVGGGKADFLPCRFDSSSGTLEFETDSFTFCALILRDRPAVTDSTDENPPTGE